MSKNICCIFNLAPHYRYPIYKLMDTELNCDFYFGDKVASEIKKLDYSKLNGFKKELRNTSVLNTSFTWMHNAWPILFKKYKYYIITGDPYYLSNWMIAIIGGLLGKKVIPWSHGMKGNSDNKMEWFEKLFFKLCPLILLYGNHSRNIMIKEGFKPSKLVCIYNSLDNKKQVEVRKKLSTNEVYKGYFNNDYPVLLYIGRIQKSKNLELLVECVDSLNKQGTFCNLVFIGKDLGDNEVFKTAERLELLDKIWFYGPSYEEKEIGELIYNAKVCISPGPVGLTALHSLTYGTPVITNNSFTEQMPEHEVIVPGETGDFFKNGCMDDLISKTKHWLTISDKERVLTRETCYKIIQQRWTPETQVQTLKKILIR